MTPIFRFLQLYRTASYTTGGWSRWNILMCLIYIYILALRSLIFGPYGCHLFFLQDLPFLDTFPMGKWSDDSAC